MPFRTDFSAIYTLVRFQGLMDDMRDFKYILYWERFHAIAQSDTSQKDKASRLGRLASLNNSRWRRLCISEILLINIARHIQSLTMCWPLSFALPLRMRRQDRWYTGHNHAGLRNTSYRSAMAKMALSFYDRRSIISEACSDTGHELPRSW